MVEKSNSETKNSSDAAEITFGSTETRERQAGDKLKPGSGVNVMIENAVPVGSPRWNANHKADSAAASVKPFPSQNQKTPFGCPNGVFSKIPRSLKLR